MRREFKKQNSSRVLRCFALPGMTSCVERERCFALLSMTFGYTNFIPLERANKQLSLFFLTPTPFGYLPLAKLLAFVVQLQTSLHCTHLLATFLFQKRKSFYHAVICNILFPVFSQSYFPAYFISGFFLGRPLLVSFLSIVCLFSIR